MPIPADILAVERPKNTIVIAYGARKDHYAVRERKGTMIDGKKRRPINGATVGHIIDGAYMPLPKEDVSASGVDLKGWAGPFWPSGCSGTSSGSSGRFSVRTTR